MLLAARDFRLRRIGFAASKADELNAARTGFELYVRNPGLSGQESWRLIPQEIDQAAYRYLIADDRRPGPIKIDSVGLLESDSRRLLQAFNYFLREMSRRSLPASVPFELVTFADLFPLEPEIVVDTILNRLFAIKIITGGTDDANMIFESLNTKGRDLQQVDLIKNFLYLSLEDQASDIYKAHWRPMEKSLRPEELEKFAWASLVSRGTNVLQKRVYEAVQRGLRDQAVSTIIAYVADLHEEAVYFERMLRPAKEPNEDVRVAIDRVVAAGGSTALPLVLYCYRELRLGGATPEEFVLALAAIESFLVRRMLTEQDTNNLNSMFGSMCARLHTDPKYLYGDDLLTDVRRILSSRPADWPTDVAVLEGIRTGDFYNEQKSAQRQLILQTLDAHFNTSGVTPNYDGSDKSIEHIAPKERSSSDWMGGPEWSDIQERIHALSNLTLLTPPLNSSLGNFGWEAKRPAYEGNAYSLTARVAEMFDPDGGWTIARLNERAADLATAVTQIWPRAFVPERDTSEPPPDEGDVAMDELVAELDELVAADEGMAPQVSAESSLLDVEVATGSSEGAS